MADRSTSRATLIAAGLIFALMLIGSYFLPDAVNFVAQVSPWLGVGVGIVFVLAVFLVFWLRARYQRRHGN